jgi:hypothetical protein
MHDIYDSVMAEVKRHGFWRPCYGRVRFKVPWISPAADDKIKDETITRQIQQH